jgi:hypothetical protein
VIFVDRGPSVAWESLVSATVFFFFQRRMELEGSINIGSTEYKGGCCKPRHHHSTSQSVREGSRIPAISRSSTTGAGFCWDYDCSTRQRMFFRGWVPRCGFCSPYVRKHLLDAKTSLKDSMAICNQAGTCLYAIFFLMQTGFLA